MDIKLQYNDYTFTVQPEYTFELILSMGAKYMQPQLDSFTLMLLDDKDGAVALEQEHALVNKYYDNIMNDLQDMFDDGLLDAEAEILC